MSKTVTARSSGDYTRLPTQGPKIHETHLIGYETDTYVPHPRKISLDPLKFYRILSGYPVYVSFVAAEMGLAVFWTWDKTF